MVARGCLPHDRDGLGYPRRHSPCGYAQHRGDLFACQTLVVVKDYRRPQLRAQGLEGFGDHVLGLGLVVLTAVGCDIQAGRQETGELLPPEVGDGEIDPDPPQPGAWGGGWRVALARTVGADERLLGQVLGRGRVEHDGPDRAIDRRVLARVELPELSRRVELLALGHPVSVGQPTRLVGCLTCCDLALPAIRARMARPTARDSTVRAQMARPSGA